MAVAAMTAISAAATMSTILLCTISPFQAPTRLPDAPSPSKMPRHCEARVKALRASRARPPMAGLRTLSLRTAALAALAMCAFAANSLLCRAALGASAVDPFTFTAVRLASGALMLAGLARAGSRRTTPPGAWVSATALFVYAIAFSLAYLSIPAAVGALTLFGAVQATMIGWGLLAGDRPRAGEWLGVVVSVGGLVGLTLPGLAAPDPLGVGLMLAAGVAWGVYSLRGRGAGDPLGTNAANFARSVPLALLAALAGLASGGPQVSL